jgi:hypothetical protein
MRDGTLPNGQPQLFYFPKDHPSMPSWFKGMELIIRECGLWCYGRLAVVSDVDDGGFALNVDKELRGSAVLYRSKYNGAMLGSRWT